MFELALIAPVLLVMLSGLFSVGMLLSDRMQSSYAVQEGARVAAELGGSAQYAQLPPAQQPTQQQLDEEIVQAVIAQTATMYAVHVTEVDIYQPTNTSGAYQSGDPLDAYTPDGSIKAGSPQSYTLDLRTQTVPGEAQIGVQLLYSYQSTVPVWTVSLPVTEYAVMRLAPLFP